MISHSEPAAETCPQVEQDLVLGDLAGLHIPDDLSLPEAVIDAILARSA